MTLLNFIAMSFIKLLLPCVCLTLLFATSGNGRETSKAIKSVLSKFKSTWVFNYGMMEFLSENMKPQTARIKFILLWFKAPRSRLTEKGQKLFKTRGCLVDNCFITDDHNLFRSINYFDVLLFHAPETFSDLPMPYPYMRSSHQKYVFVSALSSDHYPMCSKRLDNYFNMTWTYKLDSDVYFGYIIIKNIEGDIIGPKEEMDWKSVELMAPISDGVKAKLRNKTLAAAWYISDCTGTRMKFSKQVEQEMNKYNLSLDIYGDCGPKNRSKIDLNAFLEKLQMDYYFYFSFERYFSDDFVTGELLRPLNYFAIPVVYGAANYTRFMPDGIYLNAYKLGPDELVQAMLRLITDKNEYYNYFKWHSHYSYHKLDESPKSDFYCQFCAKVNDEKELVQKPAIQEFQKWWMKEPFRKDACAIPITNLASIEGLE